MLFLGGGLRAAQWIWTYGTHAKRGAQSEKRPKSLGLSGGSAVNSAVTNCLGLYVRWGVYACPSQNLAKPR